MGGSVSRAHACMQELGETWASRNSFSYGRGAERGAARPDVLRKLLATTDRVVQQVDSVEYGLTDIQVRRSTALGRCPRPAHCTPCRSRPTVVLRACPAVVCACSWLGKLAARGLRLLDTA